MKGAWLESQLQCRALPTERVVQGRKVPSAGSPLRQNFVRWRLMFMGQYGTASYILLLARSLTWLLDFFFFNLCTRAVERASTWKYRSVNNSNLPSLSVNVHRKICMRCINFLQTKRRLLYLKIQFVLRSEHLSSRL